MAFTVKDFHDLVRLLREHPEWREELRGLLLTDELLTLPQVMRRLAAEVRALAEAQRKTEERVDALAEEQRRLEESLRALTMEVRELAASHRRLEAVVGAMRGDLLELTYKERAGAYFGTLMRKVRVVKVNELEERIEPSLTREEYRDLLYLDLLVRGRLRDVPGEPEVWLAVEVSATVDEHDVERAARRARLLNKAGFVVLPVAAGERVEPRAQELAQVEKVALMEDGEIYLWEEVRKEWLGEGEEE